MSREELKGFINATERSFTLRTKLKECKTVHEIIMLSKEYGFTINSDDLKEDKDAEYLQNWFKISIISPIKKNI